MSWKCKPVVGSSNINNTLSFELPWLMKDANFILCASPPERVAEDWPNVI